MPFTPLYACGINFRLTDGKKLSEENYVRLQPGQFGTRSTPSLHWSSGAFRLFHVLFLIIDEDGVRNPRKLFWYYGCALENLRGSHGIFSRNGCWNHESCVVLHNFLPFANVLRQNAFKITMKIKNGDECWKMSALLVSFPFDFGILTQKRVSGMSLVRLFLWPGFLCLAELGVFARNDVTFD